MSSAEPVEKVQLANSGILDLDKNQLLIGLRIRQKSQILGFFDRLAMKVGILKGPKAAIYKPFMQ
jgi:hypothetical protein